MTNYRKKLLWLYARKRGSGSGGISVSVSGTTPVTLANAIESAIRHMTQFGKVTQSGTPTAVNPVDIVCNNGALKWDSENQRIYADGTPEVLTVSADDAEDQTASVENLLAVGPVADEQDIITGKVIRRTEVFRYDGTQTVKPTFMSTTGGKDDGAIIVQPRGAEYAGDVVSFEAEEGKSIDSLKVTLTPKQEGTGDPSPDNVRPITGTEECEVVRCGKNVLNLIESEMVTKGWNRIFPFTISAGTYIISCQNKFGATVKGANVSLTDEGDVNIIKALNSGYTFGDSVFVGTVATITTEEAAKIKNIRIACRANDATYASIVSGDIQLEVGTEPTAFVPFDPLSTMLSVEWGAVGKNLWDEEWEVGQYLINTGAKTTAQGVRCKNPIPVQGGASYYICCVPAASSNNIGYVWYDASDAYISGFVGKGVVTAPSNAKYMRFFAPGSWYGTTYNHDIAINYPATVTTYSPYTKTIYGGHLDAVRGEIELTMAEVDLGSLDWNYNNESNVFYAQLVPSPADISISTVANALCSNYPIVAFNAMSDKQAAVAYAYQRGINIKDSSYVSKSDFKTAMQGVQLVYELSTPIRIPLSPQTLTALQKNTVWADAGPVDVLLVDEETELVAKQPILTADGDNTVSVVSEVGEVELAVTYKGGTE